MAPTVRVSFIVFFTHFPPLLLFLWLLYEFFLYSLVLTLRLSPSLYLPMAPRRSVSSWVPSPPVAVSSWVPPPLWPPPPGRVITASGVREEPVTSMLSRPHLKGRGGSETLYHRDDALLYIAYVMLIWAAPIPADRWHCSLWP